MTHDLAASGLRFGIEEEFFLLDASDLDIVRSAPAGFVAACRDTLGEHFAEEMFECQVEVASPVFSTLAEAARFHGQARQRLAHLAMDFGLRSLCVGTHPFADWRRARSTPAAPSPRLFEDQGRVARRSLVCGLHVHVEIPPSHDRMAVLQRVLPWLPLLLALSASSPFRGGRRSGLASYRRALCGEWPRMNIPPALPDEDAYRRHLALLREAGCIREDGQVWWMIRPSSHVPTLELRICDACPRLADALSLAGLFRALVGEALGAGPRTLPVARDACLEENYWQALRYGCAGRYLVGGRAVGAGDWLEMAWRQCRPQARQGNEWAYEHARGLLGETSASRQLRRYQTLRAAGQERHVALRRLVEELLEENLQPALAGPAGKRAHEGGRSFRPAAGAPMSIRGQE
ncbi:carboxylate-amine ligase [Pseudomonas aeruginosa]|uniref:carboxylate-amine ligase n=1 Tax=Pseudomonas aeruginosa TaxID=287 RepID=UPI0006DCD4E1|nr:carboxylate-amine ligase [Pseudomonas aeruginosa]